MIKIICVALAGWMFIGSLVTWVCILLEARAWGSRPWPAPWVPVVAAMIWPILPYWVWKELRLHKLKTITRMLLEAIEPDVDVSAHQMAGMQNAAYSHMASNPQAMQQATTQP